MDAYSSYQDALNACHRSKRYTLATLDDKASEPDMHLHDCHEIYFAMQTGRHFVVMDRLYSQQTGDLFIVNPYEAHKTTPGAGRVQKQTVLFVYPEYLRRFHTQETDLSTCFLRRPEGFSHRFPLTHEQRHYLWSLLHKMTSVQGFGADLMEQAHFLELMVWIGNLYLDGHRSSDSLGGSAESIWTQQVLTHIHMRIAEPLSIESISAAFEVSSGHLCRVFRKETGCTVAKYISACRIARAKQGLAQGMRVQEAQRCCGFGDYSHFIRVFGQIVGVSPKQYALRCTQEELREDSALSDGASDMLWIAGGAPDSKAAGHTI